MNMCITKQKQIEEFVNREIYVCQSMLVEKALKTEFFSWDDVVNIYRQFDGKLLHPNRCLACKQESVCLDSETGMCELCFEENNEPQEMYEWWVVSDWLEIKLKIHGEPVLSNEYGRWWGRCTTGQSICLDPVIKDIYSEPFN